MRNTVLWDQLQRKGLKFRLFGRIFLLRTRWMAEALLGTAQYTDDIQYVGNEGIQDRLYFERDMCVCG